MRSEKSNYQKFVKYENKNNSVKKIQPFINNIEELTINNKNYRNVIYTSPNKKMQLVLMSLKPNEKIGMEIHNNVDQFFRIDKGNGKLIYINEYGDNINKLLKDGDVIIIPAGTYHDIVNIDQTHDLKLYTIYTPANHKDKTIHKTKDDEPVIC
jgi:mannose-6-phosphate isomerase-like protein (cupin superfamily)